MNKPNILLLLALTVGSATLFSGCDPKTETKEKITVTVQETEKPAPVPADTLALNDTATTVTETAPVTTAANAEVSQKFGHINSADLIQLMPETKKADANLQTYVKSLEGNLTNLQNDYRKKITEFQTQEKTMVDAIKETKIKAIQELEMQMQESQAEGQQKVAQRRDMLYKPILEKAEKAIKAVGKENGFDYIFDTNAGSFVYAKDSHDVMPLVKAKLNLR